jgi:hypothetical protein
MDALRLLYAMERREDAQWLAKQIAQPTNGFIKQSSNLPSLAGITENHLSACAGVASSR